MEEKVFLLIKNAGGEKGANNSGIGVPIWALFVFQELFSLTQIQWVTFLTGLAGSAKACDLTVAK